MRAFVVGLVVVVILAAIAATYYFGREAPQLPPPPPSQPAPPAPPPAAPPGPRFPVEPAPAPTPLPSVKESDPVVAEETAEALRRSDQAEMLGYVTRYVRRVLPGAAPADICNWIDHGQAAPAARFWTLDPIDGTKGFLRGEQYAIALALIVGGRVQVGALACPNLTPSPSPRRRGESSSPFPGGEGGQGVR